jgi:hypothetical protein
MRFHMARPLPPPACLDAARPARAARPRSRGSGCSVAFAWSDYDVEAAPSSRAGARSTASVPRAASVQLAPSTTARLAVIMVRGPCALVPRTRSAGRAVAVFRADRRARACWPRSALGVVVWPAAYSPAAPGGPGTVAIVVALCACNRSRCGRSTSGIPRAARAALSAGAALAALRRAPDLGGRAARPRGRQQGVGAARHRAGPAALPSGAGASSRSRAGWRWRSSPRSCSRTRLEPAGGARATHRRTLVQRTWRLPAVVCALRALIHIVALPWRVYPQAGNGGSSEGYRGAGAGIRGCAHSHCRRCVARSQRDPALIVLVVAECRADHVVPQLCRGADAQNAALRRIDTLTSGRDCFRAPLFLLPAHVVFATTLTRITTRSLRDC